MRHRPRPPLPFMKMHGLGNDFVVVDARDGGVEISARLARALGDRHRGVGFDQLALIREDAEADLALDFWNADGSRSSTCGNATRCIAEWEMTRTARRALLIRTGAGHLACARAPSGHVQVNMGQPQVEWPEIPLRETVDTLHLPLSGDPVGTGLGNPHCTYLVEDAEAVDLEALGARTEHDPLFPERTNVEVAQVLSRDTIRLRIWERGVGVTLASGSCASAAAVAATRRSLVEGPVRVLVDGGELRIDWREDGVWLEGETAHVFDGVLTAAFVEALDG